MTINLAAQNTGNQHYTINSLSLALTSDIYYLGNVSSFIPVTIAANKQTIIPLQIRLSIIGVTNDIIKAFDRENTTKNLTLDGYVNVDNLQIPLNLQYKVGL